MVKYTAFVVNKFSQPVGLMGKYLTAVSMLAIVISCLIWSVAASASTEYIGTNGEQFAESYKTTTTSSVVSCGFVCSTDKKCNAFNYQESSETCELVARTNGSKLNSLEGWKAYRAKIIVSDCYDVLHKGIGSTNGVYMVQLHHTLEEIPVFCDMTTDGGGWTVFQYRFDGSVDFYRNLSQYEHGFGSLSGEFWLGLKHTHEMTMQARSELRLDLEAADGGTFNETYHGFNISSSPDYNLHYERGDKEIKDLGLDRNIGNPFSTADRNMTGTRTCVERLHGCWWYRYSHFYGFGLDCTFTNLNGLYYTPGESSHSNAVFHDFFKKYYESLKSTKMMFRRV